MLSAIIPLIRPPYFLAILVGITASPGESIAGVTSPAPLGPGTLTTPFAYFGIIPPLNILSGSYVLMPNAAKAFLFSRRSS